MATVELWTLYAFGVSFTILRTYARISAVGFRELQVDDYLIWVAVVSSENTSRPRRLRTHIRHLAHLHSAMQSRVQSRGSRPRSREQWHDAGCSQCALAR